MVLCVQVESVLATEGVLTRRRVGANAAKVHLPGAIPPLGWWARLVGHPSCLTKESMLLPADRFSFGWRESLPSRFFGARWVRLYIARALYFLSRYTIVV